MKEIISVIKKDMLSVMRQQHWEIISLCDSLDRFLSIKNLEHGSLEQWFEEKTSVVFYLNSMKKILAVHIALEGKYLYPALLNSKNKKTRELTLKLWDEMDLIREHAFSFFEKYRKLRTEELLSNNRFRLDLSVLTKVIRRRVSVEEEKLFPLYNLLSICEKEMNCPAKKKRRAK